VIRTEKVTVSYGVRTGILSVINIVVNSARCMQFLLLMLIVPLSG